jgi:hypothetical protein
MHTSEFLPGEMGEGTTSFHFTLPALTQWSFSTRTKREQIATAITQQDAFHLKAGTIPATTILNPKPLLR